MEWPLVGDTATNKRDDTALGATRGCGRTRGGDTSRWEAVADKIRVASGREAIGGTGRTIAYSPADWRQKRQSVKEGV
jgi:hypothetical protein